MKKIIRYRFYAALAAVLLILSGCAMPEAYAQSGLSIVHNDYDALSVNHVEIEPLKYSEGVFSSNDPDIKQSTFTEYESADGNTYSVQSIAYHGQVKWGKKNTTLAQNAEMEKNTIPGTFTMRFENKAKLSDGTRADVLFRFSDWEVYLGAEPENVSAASKVFVPIISGGAEGRAFRYVTETVRTGSGENDVLVSSVKQRIKTTVTIVRHGTNEPVDAKYEQLLIGFRDLDVPDNSIAGGADPEVRYAGRFAESIELVSGFFEPILITDEGSTKTVIGTADGNMFIRGTELDSGTMDSGFVCGASPQGYSYYWYGSSNYSTTYDGLNYMGTGIAELDKVSVGATAGPGGKIEKQGSTAYVLNGKTSYKYTPDEGYYVASLTVDGEEEDFLPEGGIYDFDKLTSTDAEGDDHTIEVRFEAYPVIEIEKAVSNETPEEGDEIEYTIEIREINDNAVLRNAVMTDALPEGIEIIEDSLECSEDGEASLQDGVITYTQDELSGDAAISFRAVVTEQSGTVRNNAVLEGDMAEPVQDDAVITVGNAAPNEDEPDGTGGDASEDDDNAGKTYDSGASNDQYKDKPAVDDIKDETYDPDPEDQDPGAPRTGDRGASEAAGYICIALTAFAIIWRLFVLKRKLK